MKFMNGWSVARILAGAIAMIVVAVSGFAWGQVQDNTDSIAKNEKAIHAAAQVGRVNNVFLEAIADKLDVKVKPEDLLKAVEKPAE